MEELIGSDGVVRRGIIPVSELRPLSSDEFDLNDSPLVFHFVRDKNSNVTGFVLNGFSERGILFTRVGKVEIKP